MCLPNTLVSQGVAALSMTSTLTGSMLGPLLGGAMNLGFHPHPQPTQPRRRRGGGGGRSGCDRASFRWGLGRSSRLGRFGGHRSSGLGRGAGGAAELGLGRDSSGVAAGVGAAADAGCAVGGQRSCRRIRFPIDVPRRARAGRSGGRCWGRRGRCRYEIPATP